MVIYGTWNLIFTQFEEIWIWILICFQSFHFKNHYFLKLNFRSKRPSGWSKMLYSFLKIKIFVKLTLVFATSLLFVFVLMEFVTIWFCCFALWGYFDLFVFFYSKTIIICLVMPQKKCQVLLMVVIGWLSHQQSTWKKL